MGTHNRFQFQPNMVIMNDRRYWLGAWIQYNSSHRLGEVQSIAANFQALEGDEGQGNQPLRSLSGRIQFQGLQAYEEEHHCIVRVLSSPTACPISDRLQSDDSISHLDLSGPNLSYESKQNETIYKFQDSHESTSNSCASDAFADKQNRVALQQQVVCFLLGIFLHPCWLTVASLFTRCTPIKSFEEFTIGIFEFAWSNIPSTTGFWEEFIHALDDNNTESVKLAILRAKFRLSIGPIAAPPIGTRYERLA
ncbi:hypothetical protein BJ508DRAFT_314238 [Ascobolus immersus RN42]|uniref:Uncharacterized protein n=1 Tax=Ascobolus immersus RN42 TaxID=1160509 RepID=A0A3N4HLL6_ASCIM|nr:hypothetical protein BJ508DRAFT_314238 [Ascobolus immersus RN42]